MLTSTRQQPVAGLYSIFAALVEFERELIKEQVPARQVLKESNERRLWPWPQDGRFVLVTVVKSATSLSTG